MPIDVDALIQSIILKHEANLIRLRAQDAKDMANEIAYVVSAHLQQDVQETDCLERSPVTPVIVLNEVM